MLLRVTVIHQWESLMAEKYFWNLCNIAAGEKGPLSPVTFLPPIYLFLTPSFHLPLSLSVNWTTAGVWRLGARGPIC